MGWLLRIFAVLTVLSLAGWLGFWGFLHLGSEPLSGVQVGGRPYSELDQSCESVEAQTLTLEAGAFRTRMPRAALGSVCDRERIRAEAVNVARRGHPIEDVAEYFSARSGQVDLPLHLLVDDGALRALTRRLVRQLDRPAMGASVQLEENRAFPAVYGSLLDEHEAFALLRQVISRGASEGDAANDNTWIKLPTRVRIPDGLDPGKNFSLAEVLATFETEFYRYGESAGRAHNVTLAADRLDGVIIRPGQTFSFNDRVGPRPHRDGSRTAKVIIQGELVDGAGGGVCQAASTLHAAAFFAGLRAVEYEPHSRPSSYIPMGLDATVVWPYTDLKIKNPFDFPVTVRSWVVEGVHRVEIRGRSIPREVELDREFVSTRTFTNRVVADPTLGAGQRVVVQGGIRGYTVRRVRTLREGDQTFVDEDVVVYPPTDRIVRVGGG